MPERNPPVPELLVERLALGDLDAESAAAVRARLEAAGDGARVGELAASNRAILDAHPAAGVLAEARRRLDRPPPAPAARAASARLRGFALSAGALGAAAAAAMIFVAVRRPVDAPADRPAGAAVAPAGETIVQRGLRPHLVLYKQTREGPARLAPGSRARPGDLLQVAYVAAGRRYGIIASQDARGTVTFHLPAHGPDAVRLEDGGEIPAANAFELDDSPGFERFVFVTSDQPFRASAVLELLRAKPDQMKRATGEASPSPALSVMDLLVHKEVR